MEEEAIQSKPPISGLTMSTQETATSLKAVFQWAEFFGSSAISFCFKVLVEMEFPKDKRRSHSPREIPPCGKRPLGIIDYRLFNGVLHRCFHSLFI